MGPDIGEMPPDIAQAIAALDNPDKDSEGAGDTDSTQIADNEAAGGDSGSTQTATKEAHSPLPATTLQDHNKDQQQLADLRDLFKNQLQTDHQEPSQPTREEPLPRSLDDYPEFTRKKGGFWRQALKLLRFFLIH